MAYQGYAGQQQGGWGGQQGQQYGGQGQQQGLGAGQGQQGLGLYGGQQGLGGGQQGWGGNQGQQGLLGGGQQQGGWGAQGQQQALGGGQQQALGLYGGQQGYGGGQGQQGLLLPGQQQGWAGQQGLGGQQRLGGQGQWAPSGQQSTFTAVETIPKGTCIIIGNGTQGNLREHASALSSNYILDAPSGQRYIAQSQQGQRVLLGGATPSGQHSNVYTAIETAPQGTRITIGNGTQGNLLEHASAISSNYALDNRGGYSV